MTPTQTTLAHASEQIDTYEQAGQTFARLVVQEMELADQRPLVKASAIQRILDEGRATSATAAEKIVESDAAYAEHLALIRRTVLDKNLSLTRMQAERLRAQLSIAALLADESVIGDVVPEGI